MQICAAFLTQVTPADATVSRERYAMLTAVAEVGHGQILINFRILRKVA